MFDFIKRMWQMNRVDETYLDNMVNRGIITPTEKQTIIDSPRLERES